MKTDVSLVIFLILVSPIYSFAQQEGFILSGRILDAQSKEPVSIASLQNGRELILTNVKGEFKIQAKPGERLLISHTAYQPTIYVVEEGSRPFVEIFLDEKLVDLSEVEVSPFISEQEFKEEVLKAVPRYDYEHKVVVRNQQMIKQIVPLGYDYNSLLKHAKSVNEVSFFSTNPSVGLLTTIRRLVNPKTFKSPPIPQHPITMPFHPYGVKKEGHWRDYFEVEKGTP